RRRMVATFCRKAAASTSIHGSNDESRSAGAAGAASPVTAGTLAAIFRKARRDFMTEEYHRPGSYGFGNCDASQPPPSASLLGVRFGLQRTDDETNGRPASTLWMAGMRSETSRSLTTNPTMPRA